MTAPASIYQPNVGAPSCPQRLVLEDVDWQAGLLIRSTNWLGDALMTLPGCFQLSTLLPADAELIVLCPAKLASFWQSVPWVADVLPFEGKRVPAATRAALRTRNPGVAVVLPNSFGSALDLWRAGVRQRIGRGGRGRNMMLTHRLPVWRRVAGQDRHHEARKYLELAACCGAEGWSCEYPPLQPQLTDAEAAELADLPDAGPCLVIAPGAAYGPAKQWPTERFRAVAEWWADSHGPVIAVGAPGEEEVASAAIAGVETAINLAGRTNLSQLMYVLQQAACLLTNDSGSMHLGAALGQRGVAIFGSTDPIATGPLGGRWIVLQEPVPCSPCLARTCEREDAPYDCLQRIDVTRVREALQQVAFTKQ